MVQWIGEARPETLRKLIIVVLSLVLAIAASAAGLAAYRSAQAKSAELRIKGLNTELRDMQGAMKQVNEVLASGSQVRGPIGRPIVVKFQSAVEKAARENGVRVEDTRAGDPAIFLSRFKNEPDGTLQQIEVQMTLAGSIGDVVRTLDQFTSFRIPFEFGESTITRDTSAKGVGKVLVRVSAYVLVPNQV